MKLELIKTVKDTVKRLDKAGFVAFYEDTEGYEGPQIVLFPELAYQAVEGFGGAFTEAASTTLDKLSAPVREKILKAYFDPNEGIGYNFCRTHINSCDFSLGNYSYVKDGDKTLDSFDISRDRASLIPMIKAAMHYGDVRLFASPWSPPAYMKSNGEMNHGGKLLPQYYDLWADYFVKYLNAYRAEGIRIWGVTVQNEAKAVQTWDSCVYTAEEEREFVRDYLGPRLEKLGVKIMFWDHNKERLYERAKVMYSDPRAAGYIYGSAFHWYSGDHFEQLAITAQQYPDKKLLFTEGCQEYSKNVNEPWLIGERYAHDIIGNFNHGCNAFTDWNLLLNEKGGPNHVGNFCDAPILADTSNDSFSFSNSYYYIGHFSKYIRPGAKRIAFSKYTDLLDVCAFQNPGGDIVLVVLNRTQDTHTLSVRMNCRLADLTAEPRSILTCLIRR